MIDIEDIYRRHQKADSVRMLMSSTWRDVARHVRPIKQDIGTDSLQSSTPTLSTMACLYDSAGIEGNQTYAAGCMSWMTPSETTWFGYDAPFQHKADDAVKQWYADCTDEAQRILAGTNFYSAIHEVYLDDGAFGTSGLIIEEDAEKGIRFEALQIDEYALLENANRDVDTLFRVLNLSPRQAVQKWGDAVHPDVKKCIADNKDIDKQEPYLHCVMPRGDREYGKSDGINMPWAVVWIDKNRKHIVEESGAWECPFAVHRHALWSHLPYGFSPGIRALPDCRQLNLMQKLLDTLVEKQVTPPVIAPAGYKGRIDLRRGGITYKAPSGEGPEFWQNPGNYMIGEDRIEFRRRQINASFHVEMFQALASVPIGKEMTAAEVNLRQRDRLTLFSPTFARKNQELNNPVMRRVFGILMRLGAFPEPPRQLLQLRDGQPFIPDPEIIYTSRLALQLKAIHNDAYLRVMDSIMPLMGVAPDVLDHFDLDKLVRDLSRNEGLRSDWLRPERMVADIRRERQQMEQQAMEQQAQLQEADAASKLLRAA
jgi:hypothetical protein